MKEEPHPEEPATRASRRTHSARSRVRSAFPVTDFEHLDRLGPGRGAQLDGIALMRLQEGAGDRRDPADLAAVEVCLVDADDRDRLLGAMLIGIGDAGPEEDLVAPCLLARVDHQGRLQPLGEKADAPVDLAQPLLAVEVIAVFRTVAIARRPGDDFDGFRALLAGESAQLVLHAAMTLGCHVVLDPGGDDRLLVGQLQLVVRLLDEGLAHRARNSWAIAACIAIPTAMQSSFSIMRLEWQGAIWSCPS